MTWPSWKAARDAALFFGGLAGIAYETVGGHEPRESLLVLFAAMAGLPAFLRTDEQKKGDDDQMKPKSDRPTTDYDRRIADALVEMLKDAAKATAVARDVVKGYPRTLAYAATSVFVALGVAG